MYPNLKILREVFISRLSPLYTQREAGQLFRIALEDVFQLEVEWMLHDLKPVDLDTQVMEAILKRLLQGEPIQYITGLVIFRGLKFKVCPDVLIPRPETEELVQWIIDQEKGRQLRIADVGTGSGCIAWSLFMELPDCCVVATDISENALKLAMNNKPGDTLEWSRIHFLQHDFLIDPLESLKPPLDLIVSNPPYICESEMKDLDIRVVEFEPHIALFAPNQDPLIFYKQLARSGPILLKAGGRVYVELHESFGPDVARLFYASGYVAIELKSDLQGKTRMLRAIWPGKETEF